MNKINIFKRKFNNSSILPLNIEVKKSLAFLVRSLKKSDREKLLSWYSVLMLYEANTFFTILSILSKEEIASVSSWPFSINSSILFS